MRRVLGEADSKARVHAGSVRPAEPKYRSSAHGDGREIRAPAIVSGPALNRHRFLTTGTYGCHRRKRHSILYGKEPRIFDPATLNTLAELRRRIDEAERCCDQALRVISRRSTALTPATPLLSAWRSGSRLTRWRGRRRRRRSGRAVRTVGLTPAFISFPVAALLSLSRRRTGPAQKRVGSFIPPPPVR